MQATVPTIHTVLNSEKEAFTNHVNEVLEDDPDLKNRLPIPFQEVFNAMEDGVIFCKLINKAVPGKVPPISPQAINLTPATTYHKIQNLNLAIQSARSIGCTVVNVRPQFIMEKRQHIILGLIWQIIRIHLSNQITLRQYPEIILLRKEDEEDQAFRKLGYEEILIRWLNYHIKKDGGKKEVRNLGKDVSDSQAYGHVLNNLYGIDKDFWEQDEQTKAKKVIETCQKNGINTKVKGQDIVSGNTRLNTLLCADIFNQKHGLELKQIKPIELPPEPQTDETRQIRVFKNWINSQGIEDVYVNYLMQDLRDGRILLKVIDRLRPNSVDWDKKYSSKLHSRIHIIQNCNYVMEICKEKLKIMLVNIQGLDIVDARVSLTLGLVWQLCKVYVQERIGKIDEKALIEWGNSKVPQQVQIKSLNDPNISNCKFLLHCIESIKQGTVDFSKLREGDSQEDQIANTNYTIASARKLGAEIMTLWEHIRECNRRFVGLFLAELQHTQKSLK